MALLIDDGKIWNMNKANPQILNKVKELYWEARDIKNDADLDKDLGLKITATTREKILLSFINILKKLKKKDINVNDEMKILMYRIPRHKRQLKMLEEESVLNNDTFISLLIKFIFIEIKRLKRLNN